MSLFPGIRIEGGLLGPDTLDQILAGELPGQKPSDFGLDGRRTLTDEIASIFADARAQWEVFQHRLERLPDSDPATSVTRDAWMIPFLSLLGYELRYNPRAYELDGATFAISHRAGEAEDASPVHIVGARQELGRVAPTGRPRLAPHSLVQEFLNRSEQLWGIVTNGLTLRLLRDSTYIRRQAYVEFDLQQILEEQRFNDFAVLYRLLHRTRLPRTAADARDCLLEHYYQHALEQGGRVRDRLREGVEECIKRLANGFLAHPDNGELRARIASSGQGRIANSEVANRETDDPFAIRHSPFADPIRHSLFAQDFYRQLLRLVYRFLFLLVSEDRGLISADPLYREHYGIARLRRLLDRRSAYTDHDDLWCSLQVLWKVLADERLASLLGAAPLNGELFEPIDLDACTITNRDLLEAFWHLAYYREIPSQPPRRVNYAALDVEELGSVYESLLEYHPMIEAKSEWRMANGWRFELVYGSERKSTGSYYTPPELVAELIHSALEPVIEERLSQAKRMANSEWRMVPQTIRERFTHEVFPRLSRSGGLAKGDAGGEGRLPSDQGVPSLGTVRPDQPDAPGSRLDPDEHRRGVGSSLHSGVYPVSPPGQWEPDRVGDTAHPQHGNPLVLAGSGSADPRRTSGDRQTTEQFRTQPPKEKELAVIWSRTPFALRHSLFASHALLSVRVLDPACGSGHFLLAAARRLGKELARIRTGEDEPAPERVREAIRDVVAHCIYGVDKNPLAVELCRVALWLEAHCAGKPLTFLDHRIRCGDSLVGVFDLEVLDRGIPDDAFAPARGDDKRAANLLKKRNRSERRDLENGQLSIPFDFGSAVAELASQFAALETISDDSPALVKEKRRRFESARHSPRAIRQLQACNLWTAAFFQPFALRHSPFAITTQVVADHLAGRPHPQAVAEAEALAAQHHFFHWPLEFPEVFADGGFDVVLGNPPWERIKLQEQEFFAARDPRVANAPTAAVRKRLIASLKEENPALWTAYREALHAAESTSRFLRSSGGYPLTGRGDINTYSVFAERMRRLLRPGGRAGIIVPSGIATDDTNKFFFAHLVDSGELASLYDFENRKKLFPAVDSRMKFCLLTVRRVGAQRAASLRPSAEFAFFCHEAADLADPERRFTLRPEDFRLLNPNTRTAPILRSRRDAELTKAIYRRVPVLINERIANSEVAKSESDEPFALRHSPLAASNPWGVEFLRMFDMANDSHLFRTREELEREGFRLEGNVFVRGEGTQRAAPLLPLYEAKMIHQFDHRFGDYRDQPKGSASTQLPEVPLERLADPSYQVLPRYWVPAEEVEARLAAKGWDRGWLLGWRDITNVTNERTVIAAVIPRVGVGNNYPLIVTDADAAPFLASTLSCFPLDYVARQKAGGTHLNFFIFEQLPVLPPSAFDRPCPWSPGETFADFICPRVLELTYTAWDLEPFARDLWDSADDAGRQAILRQWEANHASAAPHSPFATRHSLIPPFRYDPERRFQLRCELDALFFHLYLPAEPDGSWRRATRDWAVVEETPEEFAALTALFPTPRDAVAYILDQFPIVKRREEERYGQYRTKETILQRYDELCR